MKKLLLLLCCFALAITGARALTFTVGNYNYQTLAEEGEVMVTGLSSAGSNLSTLNIPGRVTYNGTEYRVQQIGPQAFMNKTNLVNVYVGYGIEYLGEQAFSGCTSLSTVRLPSTTKTLNQYTFYNCTSMSSFSCAAQEPPTVYPNTFTNMRKCNVYTSMWPSYYTDVSEWKAIDSNGWVEEDGTKAYDYRDTGRDLYMLIHTDRTTPSYSARATLLTVGTNATYIPISSFTDETPVNYGGCSTGYTFNLTRIHTGACEGNTKITSVGRTDLGDNTYFEEVGDRAFRNCTSLTTVCIPSGKIYYSFSGCTSLTTVKLYGSTESKGVTQLGYSCFEGCTSLKSLYLPSSVSTFLHDAVAGCTQLKAIEVSPNSESFTADIDAYGNGQLYSKFHTYLYQVPGASNNANIHPDCQRIIRGCFNGNTQITKVDLPYGLKTIEGNAFNNSAIKSLKIPSSLTEMESTSFNGMTNCEVIYLNTTTPPVSQLTTSFSKSVVLNVPHGATSRYSAWSSLFTGGVYEGAYDIQGDGSDATHKGTFYTVTSNQSYTDTNVQASAAKGKLRMVAGKNAWPGSGYAYTQNNNTFYVELKDLVDGYIVTEIERDMYKNQTKLLYVSGGNGMQNLGAQAFSGCTSLQQIDIPYLKHISDSTFMGCTSLTQYEAPESLSWIGLKAFYGCTSMTKLLLARDGVNQTTGLNNDAFGNNASGFECFVPMRHFDDYYTQVGGWPSTGTTARTKLQPMVKATSQWLTITTCSQPVYLPGGGSSFFAVTGYDENASGKLTTKRVTGNVAPTTGLIMRTVPRFVGNYILFNTASSGNTPETNLLVGVPKEGVSLTTSNYYGNYLFDTATSRFNKITASTTVQNDQCYLHIEGHDPSTVKSYQIDQIYCRGFKYGDFWFDDGDPNNSGNGTSDVTLIAPQNGDSYNLTDMEVLASFTYNGRTRNVYAVEGGAFTGQLVNNLTLPATVRILRTDAFKDATRLKKLVILFNYSPTIGIFEENFASGNDPDFACYVSNTFLYAYMNKSPNINFLPWIEFTGGDYLPFSCCKDVTLPVTLKAYTVSGYDTRTRVATTTELTDLDIPSHTGLLLKGNMGDRILLYKSTSPTTIGTNHLVSYVQDDPSPNSFPDICAFYFNNDEKQWTKTMDLKYGYSYLGLSANIVGSDTTSPVYLDLEYTAPTILGDLNGDGFVNTGDVSVLYQAIVSGSTDALYDLNGDGNVNTGDVSMLYSLIIVG